MIRQKFHVVRVATLLTAAAGTLLADFVAPAEGPVPFRRDRIPLDGATMAQVSGQLVTLARGVEGESAASRRSAAQMLALATALDPGNTAARALTEELTASGGRSDAPPVSVDQEDRLWQILEWLESPEAGSSAQALAACLSDALRASSSHSGAPAERGAWTGWVPAISAYEEKIPSELPEEPLVEEAKATPVLLAKAEVTTLLWRNLGNETTEKWLWVPSPLQMTAETMEVDNGERGRFSIVIGTDEEERSLRNIIPTIQDVLNRQHGTLPHPVRITIGSEALQSAMRSKKRPAVSAAAAVLASSALSGQEPEATIIGTLDPSGAFKLPTDFWNQLQALQERGRGGRLVLPAAAAEYLPSILALEQPLFFLKYEVLLASNFQELLAHSAKIPARDLADTTNKFQELQSKLGNQPIGPYVANPAVRRRLAEIVREAPDHVSAQMLAIQAAGNRPSWVVRPVMIAEIRRVLEPLEWLVERETEPFTAKELERLGNTLETCRVGFDRLSRYCAKEDRVLLNEAQTLMTALRTLDRSLRTRNVDIWNFDAFRTFRREHERLSSKLALAEGSPQPETRNTR
jgi:hypothetical protein